MSGINLYINDKKVNGKTLPKYEHKIVLAKSKAKQKTSHKKSNGIIKQDVFLLGSYTKFINALAQELDLKIDAFNVAFSNYISHSTVLELPYYMQKEVNGGNILIEIRTEADEAKEEAFYQRITARYPGSIDIQHFI